MHCCASRRYGGSTDILPDGMIPDVVQFKNVDEWLASIKMSRYRINFESAGLTNLAAVAQLLPVDLPVIGITLASHQKKILNSIHALRASMPCAPAEGFLV